MGENKRPFIVIGRATVPIASIAFIHWKPGDHVLEMHLNSGTVLQATVSVDRDAMRIFEDLGYGPWIPSLFADLKGGSHG